MRGDDASNPADATRGSRIEIWRSRGPNRPYDEVSRQHVEASESILGGDSLPRSIARLVRGAEADAAIILFSWSHSETKKTNQRIYVNVVQEADIVIIRYR